MGRAILNKQQALAIKKRLFAGDFQFNIASDVGVSQASISHIATGRLYYDVPWPDGSIGPLPDKAAVAIHLSRVAQTSKEMDQLHPDDEEDPEEESVSAPVGKPAEWEQCVLVLGIAHPLVKRASREWKVRQAIKTVVGQLPVAQRTKSNIERTLPAVLKTIK